MWLGWCLKKIKLFIYILILWRKMIPTNMTTSKGTIRRKVMVGRGRLSLILIQGQKKKMWNKKTVEGEGSSSQTSSKAEVQTVTGRQWGLLGRGTAVSRPPQSTKGWGCSDANGGWQKQLPSLSNFASSHLLSASANWIHHLSQSTVWASPTTWDITYYIGKASHAVVLGSVSGFIVDFLFVKNT